MGSYQASGTLVISPGSVIPWVFHRTKWGRPLKGSRRAGCYLRAPFSAPAIYGIRGISTRVLFVTTRSRRSTGADRRGGVVME